MKDSGFWSTVISKGILKALVFILLVLTFGYVLYKISDLLIAVLIALILSLMGRPMVNLLNQKVRLPNGISSIVTLFLLVLLILGLFFIMINAIMSNAQSIAQINSHVILKGIDNLIGKFDRLILGDQSSYFIGIWHDSTKHWLVYFQSTYWSQWIKGQITTVSGLLTKVMFVIFISFFFLKDADLFTNFVSDLAPRNQEKRYLKVMETIRGLLSRYFLGLMFQMVIMFGIYALIFNFFHIKTAFLLAGICALVNVIPYIGSIVGLVLIVVLSIASGFDSGENNTLIWIIGMYLMAQSFDGFINQPIIYSRSVKSHPLEIFLVVVGTGLALGIPGVIIAIPTYTILRVVLKEFYSEFKLVRSITKNI